MISLSRLALVVAVAASTLGCGPSLVPVSGSVTLDGAPLAEASVSFTPAEGGRPSSTTTDEAGRFRFASSSVPGLSPGGYRVTVSKTELIGMPSESESGGLIPADFDPRQIEENWITPTHYAKGATSGLTATVSPGMPPVVFDLVSHE